MQLKKESKKLFAIASFFMALAIAFGAFGAHGLKSVVSEDMLRVYKTGVEYQFYNTISLMALSLMINFKENIKKIVFVSYFIIAGMVIFSFSLYFLVLLNMPILGAITPIGGSLLVVSWFLVSYYILKD